MQKSINMQQRQVVGGKAFKASPVAPVVRGRARLTVSAQAVAITKSKELEQRMVDSIRFLAIDGVNKANSGHPGMPMGCAPMGMVLFDEVMKFNPKNPQWFNRDRFVLSAGHGSMFQYSILHLLGYDSVSVRGRKMHTAFLVAPTGSVATIW